MITISFLHVTFSAGKYLDNCASIFSHYNFMLEITLNRIAYFSVLHRAFNRNDKKIKIYRSEILRNIYHSLVEVIKKLTFSHIKKLLYYFWITLLTVSNICVNKVKRHSNKIYSILYYT